MLSTPKKRHSSASKYKETSSCQPAKRGTRSPSKQKEAITCRQVRARECVCVRGPERERQRVRARERECVRQTKQEREAAKKTHSLASNKQEETIARSARQKRHSSASKCKETSSCQPAKRGTRSPSKQKETLTCQQVRARACVCARGPEQGRVCVLEKECARVRATPSTRARKRQSA